MFFVPSAALSLVGRRVRVFVPSAVVSFVGCKVGVFVPSPVISFRGGSVLPLRLSPYGLEFVCLFPLRLSC